MVVLNIYIFLNLFLKSVWCLTRRVRRFIHICLPEEIASGPAQRRPDELVKNVLDESWLRLENFVTSQHNFVFDHFVEDKFKTFWLDAFAHETTCELCQVKLEEFFFGAVGSDGLLPEFELVVVEERV